MSDQELFTLPFTLWVRKAGADHAVRAAYYDDLEIAHYVCEEMLKNDFFSEAYVCDRSGATVKPEGVPS